MRTLVLSILTLGAMGTAGYALTGLFNQAIQSPVFRELVNNVQWSGKLHVAAGALALLVGLVQFSKKIRESSIQLHMNIGRVYVALVLASTVGAFISLPSSTSSIAAKSAFWLLAILWPTVTLIGYPWRKTFSKTFHARLMIISFALTCSAISLRIFLGAFLALGISFETCYPIAAWGSITSNLIIAFVLLAILNRNSNASVSSNTTID